MAKAVGGTFSRIQFTPDLLPSDITGTRIYRASSETFDVELSKNRLEPSLYPRNNAASIV